MGIQYGGDTVEPSRSAEATCHSDVDQSKRHLNREIRLCLHSTDGYDGAQYLEVDGGMSCWVLLLHYTTLRAFGG